jgi:hypothetical protein
VSAPWHDRVCAALASPPTELWHATTPKKLARYEKTGAILPPVRGFDSLAAAAEWARLAKRSVLLRFQVPGPVQALPDHHQREGLAWWTPVAVTEWLAVETPPASCAVPAPCEGCFGCKPRTFELIDDRDLCGGGGVVDLCEVDL